MTAKDIAAAAWSGLRTCLSAVFRIATQEKLPVWLTLALTVVGTYVLAPTINRDIQKESLRREFLVQNIGDLSAKSFELVGLTQAILTDPSDDVAALALTGHIVALQHRLVQLRIAVPKRSAQIEELQRNLSALQIQVMDRRSSGYTGVMLSVQNVQEASLLLHQGIMDEVGLIY